jgi:hypothetical protein
VRRDHLEVIDTVMTRQGACMSVTKRLAKEILEHCETATKGRAIIFYYKIGNKIKALKYYSKSKKHHTFNEHYFAPEDAPENLEEQLEHKTLIVQKG